MLEFACGNAFSVDVVDFLEFETILRRQRINHVVLRVAHRGSVGQGSGDITNDVAVSKLGMGKGRALKGPNGATPGDDGPVLCGLAKQVDADFSVSVGGEVCPSWQGAARRTSAFPMTLTRRGVRPRCCEGRRWQLRGIHGWSSGYSLWRRGRVRVNFADGITEGGELTDLADELKHPWADWGDTC